jgi:hypothetical protein
MNPLSKPLISLVLFFMAMPWSTYADPNSRLHVELLRLALISEWCESTSKLNTAHDLKVEPSFLVMNLINLEAISPLIQLVPKPCQAKFSEFSKTIKPHSVKELNKTKITNALSLFSLTERQNMEIIAAISSDKIEPVLTPAQFAKIKAQLMDRQFALSLQGLFPLAQRHSVYRFAFERIQRAYTFAEQGSGGVALRTP